MRFWLGGSPGFAGLLLTILLAACQTQPYQIFIKVDGSRQTLTTEATTVRDALDEAGVELGSLDRVDPDLYVQLESGLTIVVTRVTEEVEVERETIPFEHETVVNEALAAGQTRLAQLGANGESEISIRVVYENGQEVSRTEISRVTVVEPVPEILVIGPQNTLPPVSIEGTITYISNGNAWIMRNSSGSRRALTTDGNLDGRVFGLSPDGHQLLYTTELTNEIDLPLNDMWLASTTIVGEPPITLSIQGVLQAAWSPVVTQPLIAYSTAKRTANPPGWQANNDLWLFSPPAPSADEDVPEGLFPKPVEIIPPNTEGLYPWWGTSFAWSPNGTRLAYARADQIGTIDLDFPLEAQNAASPAGNSTTPLIDFLPLQTFSDWVWVPGISWSPDSKFIAATVHGPPLASESAEESPVFNLWLISADGTFSANMVGQVGMWANPAWGSAGIAFGEAVNPLQSVNSRYFIYLIDKDGSNKRQIFPFREELGVQLPELVWSPDGQNLLFIFDGNLYLTHRDGGLPKQLTTDGQASHPQWAMAQSTVLSSTVQITATNVITPTPTPAGIGSPTASPTIIQTPPVAPSPTQTLAPTITGTIQATDTITSSVSPEN